MSAATLPEQFGRYRILKPLGKGGMGAVYLAEDTQLGRRVALKVPHIDADAGPSVLERFYREARAAAALDHPNICTLYDVGTHDGVTYMTMAYIPGHTLAETVKNGKPLTQVAAARIVHMLALALANAHDLGIVHRDLKPANVMINERGEPVVMDFGLARLSGTNAPRLTKSGAFIGTPHYMPPEQVNGDVRAIGPACDIYSLGVILYELLTGRVPFEGSLAAVVGQILTQPPQPPSAYRAGLDSRLEACCLKAMQKQIAARYASMTDFASALGECLRPASPPVARAAPARPAVAVKPSDPRFDVETQPPRPKVAADPRLNMDTQRLAKPMDGGAPELAPAPRDGPDATAAARAGVRSAAGFTCVVFLGVGVLLVLLAIMLTYDHNRNGYSVFLLAGSSLIVGLISLIVYFSR